jgi:hypothetical protein
METLQDIIDRIVQRTEPDINRPKFVGLCKALDMLCIRSIVYKEDDDAYDIDYYDSRATNRQIYITRKEII